MTDPWVADADWLNAVQAVPPIIADCICDTPGPAHVSVTGDGPVIAVAVCMGCGGILGTGSDG